MQITTLNITPRQLIQHSPPKDRSKIEDLFQHSQASGSATLARELSADIYGPGAVSDCLLGIATMGPIVGLAIGAVSTPFAGVLAGLGVGSIFLGLGAKDLWDRHQLNSKLDTLERIAHRVEPELITSKDGFTVDHRFFDSGIFHDPRQIRDSQDVLLKQAIDLGRDMSIEHDANQARVILRQSGQEAALERTQLTLPQSNDDNRLILECCDPARPSKETVSANGACLFQVGAQWLSFGTGKPGISDAFRSPAQNPAVRLTDGSYLGSYDDQLFQFRPLVDTVHPEEAHECFEVQAGNGLVTAYHGSSLNPGQAMRLEKSSHAQEERMKVGGLDIVHHVGADRLEIRKGSDVLRELQGGLMASGNRVKLWTQQPCGQVLQAADSAGLAGEVQVIDPLDRNRKQLQGTLTVTLAADGTAQARIGDRPVAATNNPDGSFSALVGDSKVELTILRLPKADEQPR